jgi:hypothetical protein
MQEEHTSSPLAQLRIQDGLYAADVLLTVRLLFGIRRQRRQAQLFNRALLEKMHTIASAAIHGEVERSPGDERLGLENPLSLVDVCQQSDERFLHQILGFIAAPTASTQHATELMEMGLEDVHGANMTRTSGGTQAGP